MKLPGARIIGTGSYLPEKILTNHDLEKLVDTSDSWIKTRTGMSERRVSSADETASVLGTEAAKKALINASVNASDIELIIVATGSPDMLFPSTACLIQKNIGADSAAAFDISAACSGFIYGLSVAELYIKTGKFKKVLMVSADVVTKYIDWKDRTTCILFGDGASAVVLSSDSNDSKGILSTHIQSDGALAELLYLPGGGSSLPLTAESIESKQHCLKMKGNSTFKIAVKKMLETSKYTLEKNSVDVSEIDLLIPHQANMRIIKALGKSLGISDEKVFVNIEKYGNTVSVTIPLALDEALQQGKIKDGNLVMMVAFGGGLTWGSTLIRW